MTSGCGFVLQTVVKTLDYASSSGATSQTSSTAESMVFGSQTRTPDVVPTACTHTYAHSFVLYVKDPYLSIYLYIYAVKLLTGPSLALFKVINWSNSKLLTGPRSFSHYKNRGFWQFVFCSVIIMCLFVSNYLAIF